MYVQYAYHIGYISKDEKLYGKNYTKLFKTNYSGRLVTIKRINYKFLGTSDCL